MGLLGSIGGLIGIGNKSANSATTTANTDNRIVNDASQGGIGVTGSNNNITTYSANADVVQAAGDIGRDFLSRGTQVLLAGSDANQRALDSAIGLSNTALRESFDFGRASNQDALSLVRDSLKSATSANADATRLVSDAYQTSKEETNGNRTVVLVGLLIAGAVGAMALRKA